MTISLDHERRVHLLALLAGAPATVVAIVLLWSRGIGGEEAGLLRGLATTALVLAWLGFAAAVRRRVAYPLQTLANLIESMRAGDFSLRARRATEQSALGEVLREVNLLAATLHRERLGALEATALLERVMAEIDVAIFAFDERNRLRWINRAGERLLGESSAAMAGRDAVELGLADTLGGEPARTFSAHFPGAGEERAWGLRRSVFREGGVPHQLVVLTDLSRVLREEERQAWQRLLRVLGHELNNSLAPIHSMTGTLRALVRRTPRPGDWEIDLIRGLEVIEGRADSLARFVGAYSRLARLPRPQLAAVSVPAWVARTAALETRLAVAVRLGPSVSIAADGDQLDQLLINLVRNAADAALEAGGGVAVGWSVAGDWLDLTIEDDGPGLAATANLFVPFFTTKPGGSGIGLVLARQIAEAHGGSLRLENRRRRSGCVARLRLPLRVE